MAKVENFDFPMGWLIDPHNKWAIHFDYKNGTSDNNLENFTIDMWGLDKKCNPINFKSRRKASKKDSLKTWKQLTSSNWTKIDYKKIKSA